MLEVITPRQRTHSCVTIVTIIVHFEVIKQEIQINDEVIIDLQLRLHSDSSFSNSLSLSALLLHNNCLINIHVSFLSYSGIEKAEAPLNFFTPSASADVSNT